MSIKNTVKNPLIDAYGRRIRKLRVSLTDRCNLRCHYCMPVDAEFMANSHYLLPADYGEIIEELIGFGLESVRITGGEPLLRAEFPDIVQRIASLPLSEIGLTTNGIVLDRHLELLKSLNILDLNISLDSLNADTFQIITHGNYLERIIANIKRATQLGFRIKTNTVIMKGVNDHEIEDFVQFGKKNKVIIRFLETMRIGYACQQQSNWFIPAQTLIDRLRERHTLTPIPSPFDATAVNFVTETGVQVGFIASESQPFCGHCSRWRLSADGILRACLLKAEGLSIKGRSPSEREEIYQQLLGMKPYLRPPEVSHAMHQIGG